MIKFEIPYNFDPDYTAKLRDYPELLKYVDCIYAPAWKDDCKTTRINVTLKPNYPKSYEEYVERIKNLMTLGIPVCILAQKNATLKVIEKYIALGIRAFTITDDKLAVSIKKRHPDVRLTLSITRALTLNDIQTLDLSMYDRIVLFFWFSRHLDSLRDLPQKYKYTILCNSGCYYDCKWHDAHWFLKADSIEEYIEKEEKICENCRERAFRGLQYCSIIEPEDLEWFDEFVTTYKIADRLDPTEQIIDNLNAYVHRFRGCPKGREYYNITT